MKKYNYNVHLYFCDECEKETEHTEEKIDQYTEIDKDQYYMVTCSECGNSFKDL